MQSSKRYVIHGGQRLNGEVTVQSAKNAISKQIVASILTDEPCIFENVPKITEIESTLEMLTELGSVYEWLDEHTLQIQTAQVHNSRVPSRYSGFNRIPILLLGPLLHRVHESTIPFVGGDKIGPRPVNFHIDALTRMGAEIETTEQGYVAKTHRIQGTQFRLPYPSVGATENTIITATVAEGTTVIENAAIEPEIIDTILFLQKMGALIRVETDRRIIVEGVEKLHGTHHRPILDRIEAASYAVAAIATNGHVRVNGAQQLQLITFLNSLRKVGGGFEIDPDGITFFRATDSIRPIHIETDVHPGFMTDWQQPFVVLLTQADGVSIVHETVYENRFGYTHALREMGADIDLTNACLGSTTCRFKDHNHKHSAIIRGATTLHGRRIEMPDIRAGFAYILAALVANGTSELTGIEYVERGYARVEEKLKAMGANIEVIDDIST